MKKKRPPRQENAVVINVVEKDIMLQIVMLENISMVIIYNV